MNDYALPGPRAAVALQCGVNLFWCRGALFPLTLTLSLGEGEPPVPARNASERLIANTATDSPMSGREFSLSLKERAWSLDIQPTKREANLEGWQMVAGGRSGQWGDDHRKAASDGRAPRRGARPSPNVLHTRLLQHAPQGRVWHPCRGAGLSCVITRRSPPPTPPATSGYPLATLRVDRSRMSQSSPSLRAGVGNRTDDRMTTSPNTRTTLHD